MSKCILVVDDDREIREIVTFALTNNGFDVASAYNGQQLQQLLSALPAYVPDLIILDVMMPGEDGYHICRNLRSDPRTTHIPIMIMTAHSEDIYQRISVDIGAYHMTKPFHPLELVERVKALVEVKP